MKVWICQGCGFISARNGSCFCPICKRDEVWAEFELQESQNLTMRGADGTVGEDVPLSQTLTSVTCPSCQGKGGENFGCGLYSKCSLCHGLGRVLYVK